MAKQAGLEWVEETFGLEPRWTKEPNIANIEMLVRQHLRLPPSAPCDVTFYAQGAFNKLYKVETEKRYALMRVTLPVDPSHKTNSEVATIQYLQQHTDIPVPTIFAFDDSSDNPLGFEWILMDMLPGQQLRRRWRKMPMDAKRALVKQVAKYQAQLFNHKFEAIGNLFIDSEAPHDTQQNMLLSSLRLGQIVSLIFFWGDHINQDISRGPFNSSKDWMQSRLSLVLVDQEKVLSTTEDEDEIHEAQTIKDITERLMKILPEIFPPAPDTPETSETTMLFHDDLSMQNILVDDEGKITGVIDWECVSTLPLWKACQLPDFLQSGSRDEEPIRDGYASDTDEEYFGDDEPLDNEGVTIIYWEHLMDYELTELREFFLAEMKTLAPAWIENMEQGAEKADFEEAVHSCDNTWTTKLITTWLDDREKGKHYSLREKLNE